MKLLVVCGPTATGKTKLAADLAREFNGELISADSRQVYTGMDIGTGKERIPGIPIWLYDVVNPDEEFSVVHFRTLATETIADIHTRGKLPIVVGGTGLYIKSLLVPMETATIPPDAELRKKLEGKPLEELQKRLQKEDPEIWKKLNVSDRQNPRRLMRKIEIALSPQAASSNHPNLPNFPYDMLTIGLIAPLPVLYERIDARVDQRVVQGIEKEIRGLLANGYTWDLPAMNTLGYKEFREGFSSHAIQQWKYDEHAYARRQMTWFKKVPNIHWYDIQKSALTREVIAIVRSWYTSHSDESAD